MPPVGAERWFHALVVVGAALGGCVGKTAPDPATGGSSGNGGSSNNGGTAPMLSAGGATTVGGRNTTGGLPASPGDCEFDAEFACQDYATHTGCHCNPTAPKDRSGCQSPFDFVCTELPCTGAQGELCAASGLVDCRCDPSRPRPEDCANPAQFFCDITYPEWRDCTCREDLPVDPASCNDSGSYCCQSEEPSFGCGCFCVVVIK